MQLAGLAGLVVAAAVVVLAVVVLPVVVQLAGPAAAAGLVLDACLIYNILKNSNLSHILDTYTLIAGCYIPHKAS